MAETLLFNMLETFPETGSRPKDPEARPPVPQEILDAASQEAARIVDQAHADAAAIVSAAHIDAEAIRQQAHSGGRDEGIEAAHTEVEAMMRREADEYRAALRHDLQEIVDTIAESRRALWEQQEEQVLAFVLDISKQVIKTEVQQNPEVLMEIIRNAMRRVTDKENLRIRVSSIDAARVKAAREDVMQIIDGVRNIEIVDDRRIGQGGCVIETNAGTIDAKIETQMAEIERAIEETSE